MDNIAELQNAQHLASQTAQKPGTFVRLGRDAQTDGRSLDHTIEREGSDGSTTIERRIEVHNPEGSIRSGRNLVQGLTHAAGKLGEVTAPAGIVTGSGTREAAIRVEWPPAPSGRHSIDASGQVVVDIGNGRIKKLQNVKDELVDILNKKSHTYGNGMERIHRATFFDQDGKVIFIVENANTSGGPGRWSWRSP